MSESDWDTAHRQAWQDREAMRRFDRTPAPTDLEIAAAIADREAERLRRIVSDHDPEDVTWELGGIAACEAITAAIRARTKP